MGASHVKDLIEELSRIAKRGPLPAIGNGSTAVGMTLQNELGIDYSPRQKLQKSGVVVTARRGSRNFDPARVNLFAMVPDWSSSPIKSSTELVRRYGYVRDDIRKLNCTVRARQPNAQALYLAIDRSRQELQEWIVQGEERHHVVSWSLDRLRDRLQRTHPATIWVTARSSILRGREHFHYRYATYSSGARVEALADLIGEGTITVDHLISDTGSRVIEKGPLFKIHPRNLRLLFPETRLFDLLSM